MKIDNFDAQMGYIRSDEAGKFLALLADRNVTGVFNGSSEGTISLREIISYVEWKTGARAILSPSGDPAPYNGEPSYSINTNRAKELGFRFSELPEWIYRLLDNYIESVGPVQK